MTRLFDDGKIDRARWSADGRQLAYATTNGNIGAVSQTGHSRRRLVDNHHATKPTWSAVLPGGALVAYVQTPAYRQGEIWTVPAAGGTRRRLPHDGTRACGDSAPTWSPDGKTLAYLRTERDSSGECYGYTVPDRRRRHRELVPTPSAGLASLPSHCTSPRRGT